MRTHPNTYALRMGGSVVHTQGQWGERFNPWLVACSTASRCCPRRGKSCQADRKLQQGPGTALTPHRPQCASQLCLCSQGEPVHMCTHTHTYPLHKCVIPTASCLMVYKQTTAGDSLPHHAVNLHAQTSVILKDSLTLSSLEMLTEIKILNTHYY